MPFITFLTPLAILDTMDLDFFPLLLDDDLVSLSVVEGEVVVVVVDVPSEDVVVVVVFVTLLVEV